MKYRGSCHCGKVAIEVEGEITAAVSCNCSICSKRGSLLWFVPREQMKVTGEPELTTYTFNKHVIKHRFCKHCGILPFGEGTDPKGVATAAINIRCLERFRVRKGARASLRRQKGLSSRLDRLFYICAGVAGFLGVALGAFAAHALKASLPPDLLAVFETGVRYQMYHVFALCAAAWGWARWQSRAFVVRRVVVCRRHRRVFRQPLSAGAHR